MSEEPLDAERLRAAVAGFINAESWVGAVRAIEAYPELLDERAPAMISLVAESLSSELPEHARAYEQCAFVLARCGEVGVERALSEMARVRKIHPPGDPLMTRTGRPSSRALTAYLEADGLEAMRILEEHPEIASAESIERIDEYIAHFRAQGDTVSVRTLEARRDLLRRW